MKQLFYWIVCFVPLFIHGQQTDGVKFEYGLTWQQILDKAKSENKYIFVDAYATWCGPCKTMDNYIYPSEKIGEYINKKFISIKVQMDTTAYDNIQVKSWYSDANKLRKLYQIRAYPTFLFFSPNGEIVHYGTGARTVGDFLSLVRDALDPETQYYSLLEKYKQNKLDYRSFGRLAKMTLNFGNRELAYLIAQKYKENYLDKLDDHRLFTYENFVFLYAFTNLVLDEGSNGRVFKFLYNYKDSADRVAKYLGFSEYFTTAIITKEEITNKLWDNNRPVNRNPDWKKMIENISRKYDKGYAEKLVVEAQLDFYRRLGEWRIYADLFNDKLVKNPPKSGGANLLSRDTWNLNSKAWDVFRFCNDKNALSAALKWSEVSIKLSDELDPVEQYYDTKASLLYKIGRVKEAIICEEMAIQVLAKKATQKGLDGGPYIKGYTNVISQMKRGEPIYISEGAIWSGK